MMNSTKCLGILAAALSTIPAGSMAGPPPNPQAPQVVQQISPSLFGGAAIATNGDCQYIGWIDNSLDHTIKDLCWPRGPLVSINTSFPLGGAGTESNLDMHGDYLVVEDRNSAGLGGIVSIKRSGTNPYTKTTISTAGPSSHAPRVFDRDPTTTGTEAFVWADDRQSTTKPDIWARDGAEIVVDTRAQAQKRPTVWWDAAVGKSLYAYEWYTGIDPLGHYFVTLCLSYVGLDPCSVTIPSQEENFVPEGTKHPTLAGCERVVFQTWSTIDQGYHVDFVDARQAAPGGTCASGVPMTTIDGGGRYDHNADAWIPKIDQSGQFAVYALKTSSSTFNLMVADLFDLAPPPLYNPHLYTLATGVCGNVNFPTLDQRLWAIDRVQGRTAVYYDSCGGGNIKRVSW